MICTQMMWLRVHYYKNNNKEMRIKMIKINNNKLIIKNKPLIWKWKLIQMIFTQKTLKVYNVLIKKCYQMRKIMTYI